jgi:hypothetical protein
MGLNDNLRTTWEASVPCGQFGRPRQATLHLLNGNNASIEHYTDVAIHSFNLHQTQSSAPSDIATSLTAATSN